MLVQEQFASRLLAVNCRLDGREPLQYRERQVKFLPEKGSLVFEQGQSMICVKVRGEIIAPRPERPSEGSVHFRVDCQSCYGNSEHQKKLSGEAVKLL